MNRPARYLLAIETSCDETSTAVLRLASDNPTETEILSEEVSSQSSLHRLYGGVVPELASREHLRYLPLLVDKVLTDAKVSFKQISAVAVTRGPGLKGCLLIGLDYAKAVALGLEIPLIGVNHIEGHVLSGLLDNRQLNFPFLCLVASGGHTEIYAVRDWGNYQLWARTNDDAAGEAFDKSAHLLGIGYPGGPKLAALADEFVMSGKPSRTQLKLPKVMQNQEGFSFSGLKTAISLAVKNHAQQINNEPEFRAELAALIQRSIVEVLVRKLEQAVKHFGIKDLVVAGGVSANKHLRQQVQTIHSVRATFPSFNHCMDNAGMIGFVAAWRFLRGERMDSNLSVLARWPLETLSNKTE